MESIFLIRLHPTRKGKRSPFGRPKGDQLTPVPHAGFVPCLISYWHTVECLSQAACKPPNLNGLVRTFEDDPPFVQRVSPALIPQSARKCGRRNVDCEKPRESNHGNDPSAGVRFSERSRTTDLLGVNSRYGTSYVYD
jgi:hypothetical protein